MKWGYISAQKPESERYKSFAVFFDWKKRPSRVSLASLGLENISQVPVNRAEVGQNHDAPKAVSPNIPQVPEIGADVDQIHDARNVVSATLSVLKSSVPIFRPTS